MSRDVSRSKSGTKLNADGFRTPALLPFPLVWPEREGEDVLSDKFEHPGAGREGKRGKSQDSRPRLNSTRSLCREEPMHSYMVRGSCDSVPHAVVATPNPDVSGFTPQFCRTPPRSTNAGDESFGGARAEMGRGSKERK